MKYTIDLNNIETREAFHEKVAQTLPVPDYYGKNLDALFDFITEKADDIQISLVNCEDFREKNWEYFNLIETVLEDSKIIYDIED